MGLISQITEFVLPEACAELRRMASAGLHLGMAINVSGRELADGSLVDRVSRHLQRTTFRPKLLTLEVTETEVMADLLQASRVLDELSGLGIRIAIDDYGTGYSSLAYIHRLPVQELKIDRSFVTNLPNEMSNKIIVRSSIAMAHSLGLSVVAEGAEDESDLRHAGGRRLRPDPGVLPLEADGPADLVEWLRQGASLQFAPLAQSTGEDASLLLA